MHTKKALFLDRDGIINIDYGYTSTIEDFEFTDGIFDFMKRFGTAGYLLLIVTNQSGIGRGYYSETDYQKVTEWMLAELKKEGVSLDHIFYCPHSPEAHCRCRKPETGMIEQALETYPIDLENSWMIGDKKSDMQLARNAGIGNTIFIGKESPADVTLTFPTLKECTHYFQDNKDKILQTVDR